MTCAESRELNSPLSPQHTMPTQAKAKWTLA